MLFLEVRKMLTLFNAIFRSEKKMLFSEVRKKMLTLLNAIFRNEKKMLTLFNGISRNV